LHNYWFRKPLRLKIILFYAIKTRVFEVRSSCYHYDCLYFALYHKDSLRLITFFYSKMFNFSIIAVSKIIKSQAVFLLVHNTAQFML